MSFGALSVNGSEGFGEGPVRPLGARGPALARATNSILLLDLYIYW